MREENEHGSRQSRIAHVGEELSPPHLVLVESNQIRGLVHRRRLGRLVEEHREREDGVKDVVHVVHGRRAQSRIPKRKSRE